MILLAHRGFAEKYPENTLSAIEHAIEAGARAVEFDIQLTRDRVPILLHDDSFERTGGVSRMVWDTPSEALGDIRVGETGRLGERFRDEPVPRLAEVVRFLSHRPGVEAFVELKGESMTRFGRAAVVDAACAALEPIRDRSIVISFVPEALALVRAGTHPPLPIGLCLRAYDQAQRTVAEGLSPEFLVCNHRFLPPGREPLWPGPWRWGLYEVTDPDHAAALGQRGASIIETMRVASMLASGLFPDAL